MKIGIVLKLFLLTAALCTLILAVIYVGQTIFFKEFYVNRKVAEIRSALEDYAQQYGQGRHQFPAAVEQDLYAKHNTWATILDRYGNLIRAEDYSIKVEGSSSTEGEGTFDVSLYNLVDPEEAVAADFPVKVGSWVGVVYIPKDGAMIPIHLQTSDVATRWSNKILAELENELGSKFKREYNEHLQKNPKAPPPEEPIGYIKGKVTSVRLQASSEMSKLLYSNRFFLAQIQNLQRDLLHGDRETSQDSLRMYDVEKDNVPYKAFVLPLENSGGDAAYLFAMTSLQPVDEAMRMLRDYYVYIVLFAAVLIFGASFYYAFKIARPLLRLNQATRKLADLDFEGTVQVASADEIGELSRNINLLSGKLQSYIGQLREDIEKEKRLERTRKEFISGVSHELKTPLSVMRSCVSILRDNVAPHKREHYFDALDQEVEKMDRLIVDMLELAKYESGTYRMQTEPFRIAPLIESVCEQLSVRFEARGLHFRFRLADVRVEGNRNRIEQVLTNYVTNAILYTPEGGEIIVTVEADGEQAHIAVENKGAHIPEDQLDKVWDRFYRVDAARRREGGGTGLGLAIAKNILELHGAPYGAANTEDGVVFYFRLNLV